MHEATGGPTGCTVFERQLDLHETEPRTVRVDRHGGLPPEAWCEWQNRPHDVGVQRSLAGDRGVRLETGRPLDRPAREPERDAEAAADSLCERRHREVGLVALERLD